MKEKAKGRGMASMGPAHWEKKVSDTSVADGKYSSEMNQEAEYKNSVDKLSGYVKKNKMSH